MVTSLKPSVAYCMLRAVGARPGDLLADPLCGCGTLPLEAAQLGAGAHFIGGDLQHDAVRKAGLNARGSRVDVLCWDVTQLPLRGMPLLLCACLHTHGCAQTRVWT